MAAGFAGPPAVDFYSMLSGLGDTMSRNMEVKRKQLLDEGQKRAWSDFTTLDPSSPDYGKQALSIAQKLGSSGDQEGAARFLGLAQTTANRQQDMAWRQQESERAQRNADRSYGLQERAAARADVQKPVFKEVTSADGTPSIVAIDPNTMSAKPVYGGPSSSGGGNPFGSGKFNNEQGKAAGFTDRMLGSEAILSGVDGESGVQDEGSKAIQSAVSNIPVLGNYMISENRQKFEQAKRDFINAQLRRESGAAISPSEFENADKQYFPVPGDSAAVKAQKAANRRASIEAMGREGGPSYRPKMVFGQNGSVTSIKPPVSGQGNGADTMLQQAREAIQLGAPRDAVLSRLRSAGIDPGSL